mgnify:CR=1 FL=1|tara:strand:+ start:144172 stop:144939 length:768 start_codon:yes stop_codon:yes gene_type:complete
MIDVVIIGAGNVASHLIEAFSSSEKVNVIQVYNRTSQSLESLDFSGSKTTDLKKLVKADCYIISVPDDAVAEVSQKLTFQNSLVVHTSGSVSLTELDPKNRRGVFYPLQTFTKGKAVDFSQIPICIEAENDEDLKFLSLLASYISETQFEVNSEKRKQLHLAAVFVCNFVNHLYHIGYQITSESEIPFSVLEPLILETAQKVQGSLPSDMQTGPAKRNDQKTMAKHLDALDLQEHKEIYKLLSQEITKTYGGKKL